MAVLHLINRPHQESSTFVRCLKTLASGDAVLLIGDGVYAALEGALRPAERQVLTAAAVFVLQPDLDARALRGRPLGEGFQPVDFDGFVDLVARYPVSISWG